MITTNDVKVLNKCNLKFLTSKHKNNTIIRDEMEKKNSNCTLFIELKVWFVIIQKTVEECFHY